MSRRTRIKRGRPVERFTLAHHSEYSSTTTYFPRAYSLIGNDITFPISILPLHSGNKITYAGTASNFFSQLDNTKFEEQNIKLVSISFQGTKYQQSSSIINLIALIFSMLCFCFSWLTSTSAYRRRFYPKYTFKDYDIVVRAIQKFKNVDTFIINFQDNDLNEYTLNKIDQAFANSNIKTIVFRNLTYFIEIPHIKDSFKKVRGKKSTQFNFIWQKFALSSRSKKEMVSSTSLCQQQNKPIALTDQL